MRRFVILLAAIIVTITAAGCSDDLAQTTGADPSTASGDTEAEPEAERTEDPSTTSTAAPTTTAPPTTQDTDASAADDAGATSDADVAASPAGSDTLDDPFVERFGNTGYDITKYDITVDWFPDEGRIDGITRLDTTATQELGSFSLDLVGFDISSITIDGTEAAFFRDGTEVRINLPEVVEAGTEFQTAVTYSGVPVPTSSFGLPQPGEASGWHTEDDYVYVFGEPVAASTWHPANDHPIDKAPFHFTISAPAELTVATVGTLQSTETVDGRTTWVYDQPFPQAPYLTTLLIGGFDIIDAGESTSGVPIRNVFDSDLVDQAVAEFAQQAAMIDAFEELFGPYPFDIYGSAVIEDSFGAALETQTLSIYSGDILGLGETTQSVIAHELAHQWFGNHVSVERWEDIWLNEGFATYGSALWFEAADPTFSWEDWILETLAYGPALQAQIHPPELDSLFGIEVYQRGALTLHALRREIGDEAFFRTLVTWNDRFGGGNAASDDFEALAEEISGADLGGFFDTWLRSDDLPDEIDGVTVDFEAASAAAEAEFEAQIIDIIINYETCLNDQGDTTGIDFETQNFDQIGFDLFAYIDGGGAAHEACADILAVLGIE